MKTEMVIPKLADFPEVVVAREKLLGVKVRLGELEREIDSRLTSSAPTAETLEADAEAMLAGESATVAVESKTDRDREIARLYRDRRVATRAVEIAEVRVRDAEQQASKEVVKAALPGYVEIQRRRKKAIIELAKANDDEYAFRQALLDDNVRLGELQPCLGPAGISFDHERFGDPTVAEYRLEEIAENYGV